MTSSVSPSRHFWARKLATLDKGNPLVSNKNTDGILVETKDNFRILVRNVAGINWCDTVLGFKTEAGKEYKIVSHANVLEQYNSLCSAAVFHR